MGMARILNLILRKGGYGGMMFKFHRLQSLLIAELQAQVQHQVRKLGWSYEMIRQFIADRFEGKRWLELNGDEQLLLLYYLQTADIPESVGLEAVAYCERMVAQLDLNDIQQATTW
jgi:hypothetical protein